MTSDPDLLTVREAARLLRVGKNLAYELVQRGEIPSLRLGRQIRVPRAALVAWIDEQCRPTTPEAARPAADPHHREPAAPPAAVEEPDGVDLDALGATLLEPRRADAEKGSSMS